MVTVTCPCGYEVVLTTLPERPFVTCKDCGRRLPVRCDPGEFLDRCPKCGRFLEKDVLGIHVTVCSGTAAPLPEMKQRQ